MSTHKHWAKPPIWLSQLILVSGALFEGCGLAPAGPVVQKELHMQSSASDPKKPQKSRPPIRETVGATSAPFELGRGIATTSFEVHAPTGPALLRADGEARHVLLRIENVRSDYLAPPFDVYLNVPPGEDPRRHPELFAFTLSTFGLVEMSASTGGHAGNGLNFLRDVTELYGFLSAAKDWDPKALRVSFVTSSWDESAPIKVQVGRVSLMIE